MPLSDLERIGRDRRHPRIVDLWFALQGLKSVVSFMQSGAHPDDEASALLAALAFGEGFAVSYACAVRGEGGQNDIGTEAAADLGMLRTAEMERAADILDMNLYWLSESPGDTILDFGFSKDGADTMARWDRDRVMRRFVEIVRTERPDILCPTFLDIPGQHGHHRAMTEAAGLVFEAAADPAFPVNLPPWTVSKLYLPAWSGAGGSYDDEVPPPPATLTVDVSGADPVTGWTWERIGQMSRACHRTQGMGRWIPTGAERDRPLHLLLSRLPGPEEAMAEGLPTLDDLGADVGAGLRETIAAFPDKPAILKSATGALSRVRDGLDTARPDLKHRLERKAEQLARVIRLAADVEVYGHTSDDWLRPGDRTELTVEARAGVAEGLDVEPVLPSDWRHVEGRIGPHSDAGSSDPYPPVHRPLAPAAPALAVRLTIGDRTSETRLPLLVSPVALPNRTVALSTDGAILNTGADGRTIDLVIDQVAPAGATIDLALPDTWTATRRGMAFTITAPADVTAGRHEIAVLVDGEPAQIVRRIVHSHVAPRARSIPASLTVRVLHAEIPPVRVGYVGGGNDRVDHWLSEIGADVHAVGDGELASLGALASYDTIVIGIFAIRHRTGLREAMPAIHDWVAAGGNLVTLYHRPWDNWDADTVPPRRLEIGQPSLRWRVTDERAAVRHLVPDHHLVTTPNRIGSDDWAGWHKERGLYFAKSWDKAYVPLVQMADPGEAPHEGALLSAQIGRGRHTHCALILHHQMEKLVPGAFRIMANLVAA